MVPEAEMCCLMYVNAIKDIEVFKRETEITSLYGLDNRRSEWHKRICEAFELDAERTWQHTYKIRNAEDYDYRKLYYALLDEKRKTEPEWKPMREWMGY